MLIVSIAVPAAYGSKFLTGLPQTTLDTARYTFSSIAQGLAAIMGLLFISFVFVYERLERKFAELQDEIPNWISEINKSDLGVRINDLYGVDETTIREVLKPIFEGLKNSAANLVEEWTNIDSGGKPRHTEKDIANLVQNADRSFEAFAEMCSNLEKLDSAKKSLAFTGGSFFASIAPLALPFSFSLICLQLIDSMTSSQISKFSTITVIWSLYGFLWLVYIVWEWTRQSIETSIPARRPGAEDADLSERIKLARTYISGVRSADERLRKRRLDPKGGA